MRNLRPHLLAPLTLALGVIVATLPLALAAPLAIAADGTWRQLGALGPGPHSVALAAPLGGRTGLYLLRLTQGGAHRTARVIFVR